MERAMQGDGQKQETFDFDALLSSFREKIGELKRDLAENPDSELGPRSGLLELEKIGIKEPGTFEREKELKWRIINIETTIANQADQSALERNKQQLESVRQSLAQNQALLEERLANLTPEERNAYDEKHNYLNTVLMIYDKNLRKWQGTPKDRTKEVQEAQKCQDELSELERRLPTISYDHNRGKYLDNDLDYR